MQYLALTSGDSQSCSEKDSKHIYKRIRIVYITKCRMRFVNQRTNGPVNADLISEHRQLQVQKQVLPNLTLL